jgi:hypothetical protein
MPKNNKEDKNQFEENMKIRGEDLLKEIKRLVHEGNIRKILIKDEKGVRTFIEIPVTVGVIGAVLMPVLAAVGALAAMVELVTVQILRNDLSDDHEENKRPAKKSGPKSKK